ncbi:protein kinase domain-containing protein [Sorangium sp. So ce1389]|uniref:serine/threonine-protein kinase n=1 Tax=Sorangium sp. So ce1389 TaxID=3133336 RepID=UPI003F601CBC
MTSLAEGSVIAGRYRLERMLARGGMGSIWVARHLQLDVGVAVKLMASEYAASTTARARFEREARAAAQLKIPNVVHVHDYGIEDDTPFLVMELLEGEDLETRLAREGRLTGAATLTIVTQVCKALRRAHEMGIIHRDLKPANLFLSRQDEDELVKVLDFGIAKAEGMLLAGKETKTGTLVGSPYYMSPEQVRRSKSLDRRSDLWSIGVIIYRCLTGRLPFPGEEIGEVFVAICTEDFPLPSSLAPELGPEVDRFFARALMRDPEHRFQSASELAEAFHAAIHLPGAEIRAPQPSAPAEGALLPLADHDDAPGTEVAGPGTIRMAPGAPGTAPGAMGTAPGAIGMAPGAIGMAPGAIGMAPGAIGMAPGAIGMAPGAIGMAPGAIGMAPGAMDAGPGAKAASPDAFASTLRGGAASVPHRSPGSGGAEGGAPPFEATATTLAPSGETLVVPPAGARRRWVPLALGALALALGLATYAVLRAPAPGDAPAPRLDQAASEPPAAAPPATAPVVTATEPLPAASHSASAAPGASSAPAAPAGAPASADAPQRPSPSSTKGAPQPARPRIPRDDPTDHM